MDDTAASSKGKDRCKAWPPGFRIALLLGPGTASSGELVAAAFHGKGSRTRSFGLPTAGLLTANGEHRRTFGDVEARLLLTERLVVVARDGGRAPAGAPSDRLVPDVRTDSPLADAVAWLSLSGT